jgi:coiled-coil domain-containing protein 63/114
MSLIFGLFACRQNRFMQKSIDNLQREWQAFDSICKKLEKDVVEKKAEMQRIIDISNVASEAKDQAQQEMAMLKTQADKEQAEFEAQWKELGKLIESDRKMKELMQQKEKAGIVGSGRLEDEDKLRKKILRRNSAIARDKEAQLLPLQPRQRAQR